MSLEDEIRKATKSGQERLWHHKGYYSIIVTGVQILGGKEWVQYFIEQNCDCTYEKCVGTFLRTNVEGRTDSDSAEKIIGEQRYENNVLRVMSIERAAKKFIKKMPSKPKAPKIHNIRP